MAMSAKRQAIWDKSGGLCWYCGCKLPERGWHADHLEPIGRQPNEIITIWEEGAGGRIRNVRTEERKRPPTWPERDHIDNQVPACASCNNMKGMGNVEQFRQQIERFINGLNRYSSQYKFAKKYGLVKETEQPVIFWFERGEGQ